MVGLKFWAVNNQLVCADTKEDAIELYNASRRDDLERWYLEQFEW